MPAVFLDLFEEKFWETTQSCPKASLVTHFEKCPSNHYFLNFELFTTKLLWYNFYYNFEAY